MTGEPFDDFQRLDALAPINAPVTAAPEGGWLSLWQLRHTVAAVAVLPGLIAINYMLAGATAAPLPVALATAVALAQAVVAASFVPQRSKTAIITCGAIPPATLVAASILLSELPTSAAFGFLAVALAATGVAFRFFATTCRI